MTIDRESPRYAQLYWHYHAHYGQAAAARGGAVDPAEQDRYAREHAEQVGAAEAAAQTVPAIAPAAPWTSAAPSGEVPPAAAPVPSAPAPSVGGTAAYPGSPSAPQAPVAGSGAPSAAGYPGAPAAAPRPRRTGLLVGAIVAGVAVIALVVAGVLVVPRLLGPAEASITRVADHIDKPQPGWSRTFDALVSDAPSLRPLGDDGLLVVDDVDRWTWEAKNGRASSYTDASSLTAIAAGSGEVRWSVPLAGLLPDRAGDQSLRVQSTRDGSRIVATLTANNATRTPVVVLRGSDGSVVSSATIEGRVGSTAIVGDRLVLGVAEGPGSSGPVDLLALALDDLSSTQWRSPLGTGGEILDGLFVSRFDDRTVEVRTEGRSVYRDAQTGAETAWSDGRDVVSVGGALIAWTDEGQDGGRLARLEPNGTQRWEVDVLAYTVVDGVLFVWTGSPSYAELGRLDLDGGRSAWPAPAGDYFPLMVDGGRVLVAETSASETSPTHWIDGGTGRMTGDPAPAPSGEWRYAYRALGASTLYVLEPDLTAYALDGSGARWTYGLSDDESVRTLGTGLYVWNTATRTLTALR